MEQRRATVGEAWTAAVAALGGRSGAAAELDLRYAEPHRHYHCAAHVEAVLGHVAVLAPAVGLAGRERQLVVLAACAHDVVYEGVAGADEAASASWARRSLLEAGVPAADADRVAALVLTTATHEAGDDPGAAVLCDADLAVLGGPPEAYATYVAAVRRDYAHVSEADWRVGRAAVLRSLLALPRLYATGVARERWDAAARMNVLDELRTLDP